MNIMIVRFVAGLCCVWMSWTMPPVHFFGVMVIVLCFAVWLER